MAQVPCAEKTHTRDRNLDRDRPIFEGRKAPKEAKLSSILGHSQFFRIPSQAVSIWQYLDFPVRRLSSCLPVFVYVSAWKNDLLVDGWNWKRTRCSAIEASLSRQDFAFWQTFHSGVEGWGGVGWTKSIGWRYSNLPLGWLVRTAGRIVMWGEGVVENRARGGFVFESIC